MNDLQDARVYDASQDTNAAASAAREGVEQTARSASDAQAELQAQVIVAAVNAGKRAFINPTAKTYSFMVKPGKLMACYAGTKVPVVPGQASAGGIEMARVGDIRARFVGGMLIVGLEDENGPDIIAWAEAHPDVCRDALDPMTETWAALRASQLDLAEKEPSLPKNINIEQILRGDFSGFSEYESATQRARRMLATP